MYAAAFDYIRASSWNDAVDRLKQSGDDAHVIAGGQSLVPMMMLRLAAPTVLIDVAGADQRTIAVRDGRLVLSALVRHVDLEHSAIVAEYVPMLTEAVRQIGNVRVRQRGTIGGSLAHGEPTAELPCVALAHGATVHTLGPDGERTIAAADLPVTHLMTSLAPGELITRVEFPVLGPGEGSCFLELARRAGDFAIVEVAALLTCDDEGRCTGARLALGAVGHRPVDVSSAAEPLVGHAVDEAASESIGRAVAEAVDVGRSTHASVAYRREMVGVLVARALRGAGAAARDAGARQRERERRRA
jgi:CO/xanthine dehydrogenase FAD-binding subunit